MDSTTALVLKTLIMTVIEHSQTADLPDALTGRLEALEATLRLQHMPVEAAEMGALARDAFDARARWVKAHRA